MMDVSNAVDLKQLIDEMDYDCRSKNPVHYNKIINNLKNLHSLCKSETDRELFTTYLSAAASPLVLADLGLAELQDRIEGLTDVADQTYGIREVVQEQTKENEMLREQMNASSVPSTMPVQPITDEVIIPNIENVEETEFGRSR